MIKKLLFLMLLSISVCSCGSKEKDVVPSENFRDDVTISQSTDSTSRQETITTLTAEFADSVSLGVGAYMEYIVDDSEYTQKIIFKTDRPVTDVSFSSLFYEGNSFVVSEELYRLDRLNENQPFVLGVVYYGDATTYGISFITTDNVVKNYAFFPSGKDDSLILNEY